MDHGHVGPYGLHRSQFLASERTGDGADDVALLLEIRAAVAAQYAERQPCRPGRVGVRKTSMAVLVHDQLVRPLVLDRISQPME
jgi:hypothetical protein